MKRQLYKTWVMGALTGAGMVLAFQLGNAQRKLIREWVEAFRW